MNYCLAPCTFVKMKRFSWVHHNSYRLLNLVELSKGMLTETLGGGGVLNINYKLYRLQSP